jgi:hypothetical protein
MARSLKGTSSLVPTVGRFWAALCSLLTINTIQDCGRLREMPFWVVHRHPSRQAILHTGRRSLANNYSS